MKVVWTQEAVQSFNHIVDFLVSKWSAKEASTFIDFVEETIDRITKNPQMFKASAYYEESREALITKHTTMFYREIDGTIEIEYFWGNFQKPEKLKGLFKN